MSDGDLFLLPLKDKRQLIGQVIGTIPNAFYVVLYDQSYESLQSAGNCGCGEPLLQTSVLPNFIRDLKKWPVVGNCTPDKNRYLPAYLLTHVDQFVVESFSKRLVRPASEAEKMVLRYRSTRSPAAVELAANSIFGLAEKPDLLEQADWDRFIGGMLEKPAMTSFEAFGACE